MKLKLLKIDKEKYIFVKATPFEVFSQNKLVNKLYSMFYGSKIDDIVLVEIPEIKDKKLYK